MITNLYDKPRHATKRTGHALVIGASMAGLLAARTLADFFECVTIIERDRLPDEPVDRTGTPQARHFHQLLTRGRQILEDLFPGIVDELTADGALMVDMAQDLIWISKAGCGPRYKSNLHLLAGSRALLEWTVRKRVQQTANVEFMSEVDVIDLVSPDGGTSVSGIKLRQRTRGGVQQTLSADFVVDASGRNSKSPQWLTSLGYAPRPATEINAHVVYASAIFAMPPHFQEDWKLIYIQAAPPQHERGAILAQIEGNRWLVGASGPQGDHPPTDAAGFLAYLQSLQSPLIAEAVKQATLLSPIRGFGQTANRLQPYGRSRWPERFVILGDAVCTFNPVYGQGMTVAALECLALGDLLRTYQSRHDRTGLALRFQKRVAKIVAAPWTFATSEDYRYRQTSGGSAGIVTRFLHWYLDHTAALALSDRQIHRLFLELVHMLKPPTVLFYPRIAAKIVGHAVRASRPKSDKDILYPKGTHTPRRILGKAL